VDGVLAELDVALPVWQAGMGGGLAGHELAAAVSEAGGLGTIGMLDPAALGDELARARALTSRPVAVNILLPFAHRRHWRVAQQADAVITFWGTPRRHTNRPWIHQVGSVAEARAAHAAGADAVIAQGVQAGGHVRGREPAMALLEQCRRALPEFPILLAGGIATAEDVVEAREAGAVAAVCGTRFLLTEESGAHPGYKRRLLEAQSTVLTELFGFGWPATHRVVPNAATDRWLRGDPRGPAIARAAHRLAEPLATRLPLSVGEQLARLQRNGLPLFGPSAPLRSSPQRLIDVAPLYAGETVARLHDVRPAAELVRALAG
jgi:NAD(P)H-dependent flavin oxidoreductase YrpB (nitropropane dioxygenase family)